MLDFSADAETQPVCFDQALLEPDHFDRLKTAAASNAGPAFAKKFRRRINDIAEAGGNPLRVGLIDCYRFSRECLIKAFDELRPRFEMLPFPTVRDCALDAGPDFDLIIYYSHASETQNMNEISIVRQSFGKIPLIVFSDAEDAHQPQAVRDILEHGAHGFIPTRTMGIPMIAAAIQFVKAGGTFVPLDLLLNPSPKPLREVTTAAPPNRLTSRQIMVFRHLKQGKANKIIAHELGMSESTVKVHVRNIMRKMGATNRTQAAYKAQGLWEASQD